MGGQNKEIVTFNGLCIEVSYHTFSTFFYFLAVGERKWKICDFLKYSNKYFRLLILVM